MEDKGHKQTSDRIEFCRVPNCKQTEYRDIGKFQTISWRFEAHHILCVKQVSVAIVSDTPETKTVIDESKWCINNDGNMMALPLWGTTIMHYCNDFSSIIKGDVGALMQGISGNLPSSNTAAPDFQDLPQHNYGHSGGSAATSYNREIADKLKKWFDDIKTDIKAHLVTGEDVHYDLVEMEKEMKGTLEARGRRDGSKKGVVGTHGAWLDPGTNWYYPFSMAEVPKSVPFPEKLKIQKIVKIAAALWRAA